MLSSSSQKGITDNQIIAAWRKCGGSSNRVAKALGISPQVVRQRRRRIEDMRGIALHTVDLSQRGEAVEQTLLKRRDLKLKNGTVVVFSDCHWWPGEPTVGDRALTALCRELKPALVIGNGDLVDGASLCRQDPSGWEQVPTVAEELKVVRTRLDEIRRASPKSEFYRTRGNHDTRFDRLLKMNAGAYEGVAGFALSDHLKDWPESWSIFINGHTCVKHRFNNGVNATLANTLRAGTNIVTGHLHRLQVTAWGDYNGRRYGVDTGTLADPHGQQFDYGEDNPTPHAQGFAVLTYLDGALLPPELCEVIKGVAYFRGAAVAA